MLRGFKDALLERVYLRQPRDQETRKLVAEQARKFRRLATAKFGKAEDVQILLGSIQHG